MLQLLPLALQPLGATQQLTLEVVRFTADDLQLLLQVLQLRLQVDTALLNLRGTRVVREDQHENHRAEATADAVEERQAEDFNAAASAHGFRASLSKVSGWCRWSAAPDSKNGASPAGHPAWAAIWSQRAPHRAVVRRLHRTAACAPRSS